MHKVSSKLSRYAAKAFVRSSERHSARTISSASVSLLDTQRDLTSVSSVFSDQQQLHRPSTTRIRCYSCTSQALTSANTTYSSSSTGEEIYQQALEALNQVEALQEARETKKSEELHRAIEKAEAKEKQHKDNPKAKNLKGVTVVKTVVKQTRKDLKHGTAHHEQEHEWKDKAHTLLQKAGLDHGHPEALILLGNGVMNQAKALWKEEHDSTAAKACVKQALEYYESAGEKDSAAGWFNVGQLLWTGYPARDEVEEGKTSNPTDSVILRPDLEAAMKAFRKAIVLDDPDAMYFVGVQLLGQDDEDVSNVESLHEGLELMRSSANLGHGPARYYLSLFCLNGHDGMNMDPCSSEEFVEYLNSATDAGDADALFLRGHSHHGGENGYPQDAALALQDFLEAANAGNADAAVSAGAMLYEGRPGLPSDQVRAFEFYQLAGEMGSLEGWRNVAACYAQGTGVPQSLPTAKYIIRTMLQEGNAASPVGTVQ